MIDAIRDRSVVSGVTTREISDDKHALAKALDIDAAHMVMMTQVHGSVIHVIDRAWNPSTPSLVGDGLITRRNDVLLRVRIADCAGVLFWDPITAIVAAVHSGWRGTKENIAGACVEQLVALGCVPSDIRVYISPCASGERYNVREDVAAHFPQHIRRSASAADTWLFNNKAAISDQVLNAGVSQTHLCVDPSCTISDERFHSYRRDGQAAGRNAAFIGLRSFEPLVPQ